MGEKSGYKHPWPRRLKWLWDRNPAQRVLNLLLESQWWTAEQLGEFRDIQFRKMIHHCYDYVPYYRNVMDDRGLVPADFRTASDIVELPVLTKTILRTEGQSLHATNIPLRQTKQTRTGGTTGEPITTRRWIPGMAWQSQCYVRGLSWGGLWPDMQRVKFFGGSLGQPVHGNLLKRLSAKAISTDVFLPAFELKPDNVSSYVKQIRDSGARHLIGYASAAYELARLVDEAGICLTLDTVFTTAEMLPVQWQTLVERVFHCRVLPYYGCGEMVSLGYQCGESDGYHRCDERAIMEVEDDSGNAFLSGEGAFLLTDLHNYAMPLLRYRNGDAGTLSDTPCSCGRGLGRIVNLAGRVNDFLVRRDGSRLSGVIATHSFRLINGVKYYQFVQDTPGIVTVMIVPSSVSLDMSEKQKIIHILSEHLGVGAEVSVSEVDKIQRTPAGKSRFVISSINDKNGDC